MTTATAASDLPIPKPTGNAAIDGLLAALREYPWDTSIRLILADAVEESGGRWYPNAIRTMQPDVSAVMQRLWPGSYSVHVPRNVYESSVRIHSESRAFIMTMRDFCDMVEGRSLLVDPEIAVAAEIERAIKVLKLFT